MAVRNAVQPEKVLPVVRLRTVTFPNWASTDWVKKRFTVLTAIAVEEEKVMVSLLNAFRTTAVPLRVPVGRLLTQDTLAFIVALTPMVLILPFTVASSRVDTKIPPLLFT